MGGGFEEGLVVVDHVVVHVLAGVDVVAGVELFDDESVGRGGVVAVWVDLFEVGVEVFL